MLRIKELREEKHMNQQELAMKLNISQASISKYEMGQAEPSIAMILALADLFCVSTDYLLGVSNCRLSLSSSDITEKEQHLLSSFRRLTELQKEKLAAYLQGLLQE